MSGSSIPGRDVTTRPGPIYIKNAGQSSMVESVVDKLRPFRWDDLAGIAELAAACEAVDQTGDETSMDVLRASLSLPGRNPEQSILVLGEDDGSIVATCGAWPTPGVVSDTIRIGVRL